MWIFTKYGFFSVVQSKSKKSQSVGPYPVKVRARLRTHLEALIERFGKLLDVYEISESAGTDYAYRILVPKAVWSQVVVGLTNDIDYGNFKSEVARFQGKEGVAYEDALHEVWSVMHGIQK